MQLCFGVDSWLVESRQKKNLRWSRWISRNVSAFVFFSASAAKAFAAASCRPERQNIKKLDPEANKISLFNIWSQGIRSSGMLRLEISPWNSTIELNSLHRTSWLTATSKFSSCDSMDSCFSCLAAWLQSGPSKDSQRDISKQDRPGVPVLCEQPCDVSFRSRGPPTCNSVQHFWPGWPPHEQSKSHWGSCCVGPLSHIWQCLQ